MFTSFTHVPSAPVCTGPFPLCDPLPVRQHKSPCEDPIRPLDRNRIPFPLSPAQVGNVNTSADSVALLLPFSGFPLSSLRSLLVRATHQAKRLSAAAARSAGALRLIASAPQLEAYVAERAACLPPTGKGCNFTAGLLGVEGSHALEGNLSNLNVLYDVGFRLMGLHHFADNDAGGSAHGVERGGLTPWGRRLISMVEDKGMLLDLAHSSEAALRDALWVATKCVIFLCF